MKAGLQTSISIIACIFAGQAAFCQGNGDGLSVSAEAYLLSEKVTTLSLNIHLRNITNHDITVLTKQNSRTPWTMWIPINDTPTPKTLLCMIGLFETTKSEGHVIVPSLSELAPVTLKSNEEAIVHLVVEQNDDFPLRIRGLTGSTPIMVEYKVLPEWGTRYACWSGEASSRPFTATVMRSFIKNHDVVDKNP